MYMFVYVYIFIYGAYYRSSQVKCFVITRQPNVFVTSCLFFLTIASKSSIRKTTKCVYATIGVRNCPACW